MLISELLGTAWRPVFEEPNEGGAGGGGDTAPAAGGDDTTPAGGGDDTLTGGDGDDTTEGGSGADEYVPFTADDLTLPEGFNPEEDETFSNFLETMNNQEFTPAERAQKILDLQTSLVETAAASAAEAEQAAWDTLQSEWQASLKADPEIGGDKLDENLGAIKETLTQLGATKETFEALDLTGAGNHPEIVKMFHKLVQPHREQSPVSGGTPAAAPKSQADRMFAGPPE